MTTLVRGSAPIERAIGFRPALSSDAAGWRDLSLYLWRGAASACEFAPFGEALAIFHTGGARNVRIRVGSRWIDERSMPGLVTIVPPATPITWDIRGEVHSASVHIAPERFARLAHETAGHRPLERLRFGFARTDPMIAATVTSLVDELEHPKERGSLYADTLADGLALHLLRNYSDGRLTLRAVGGLTERARRIACERIEDSLESGVSLDDLSSEVGLSRSHFARAFRRSTGRSPHQFLTERRVARAREMLYATDEPLVSIAIRCGFSSQAHFTHYFRRAVGLTPLAFRRSRG
jgi:AraC family transcriptional regulator